jgi:hypothetical protein
VRGIPQQLLGFIVVMLGESAFLLWRGLSRDDSTGALIAASGVVGLLSMFAFVAAVIVRSHKQ